MYMKYFFFDKMDYMLGPKKLRLARYQIETVVPIWRVDRNLERLAIFSVFMESRGFRVKEIIHALGKSDSSQSIIGFLKISDMEVN